MVLKAHLNLQEGIGTCGLGMLKCHLAFSVIETGHGGMTPPHWALMANLADQRWHSRPKIRTYDGL